MQRTAADALAYVRLTAINVMLIIVYVYTSARYIREFPFQCLPKMAAAGQSGPRSGQSFLRNLEERVMKESSIRKEALRKHVRVGCAFVVVVLSATQYT